MKVHCRFNDKEGGTSIFAYILWARCLVASLLEKRPPPSVPPTIDHARLCECGLPLCDTLPKSLPTNLPFWWYRYPLRVKLSASMRPSRRGSLTTERHHSGAWRLPMYDASLLAHHVVQLATVCNIRHEMFLGKIAPGLLKMSSASTSVSCQRIVKR